MSTPLDDYKSLIDGLTKIEACIHAKRVREGSVPATAEYEGANRLLARLSSGEKEEIAMLLQRAREGGIHDTLVFLHDQIAIGGYRLTKDGRELPVEPFDTQLYYDWMCRVMGEKWPDEKSAE